MKSEDLVHALKGVPEFKLRLVDLARELVREDGAIDFDKAAFYRKEIEEAIGEAEDYCRATKAAVRCLREIAR